MSAPAEGGALAISVITPSFNQARFLPFTLESVARQTYANVEHIVVDPGSIDGALDIARNQQGIRLINEPDEGQADGINKGFSAATGDILCWLNSDDVYPDGHVLEYVAAVFEEDPSVDVVYGAANFVNEDGEFLRAGFVNVDAEGLRASLHYQVGIIQPSVFFRRHLIEKVGVLDPTFEFTLDYEFWVRLTLADVKWKYVDRVLSHHRWWDEMKTASRRGESYVEHFRTARKHFGYVHHRWIERYADYLLTGADGIVTHSAVIESDRRRVMDELDRTWNFPEEQAVRSGEVDNDWVDRQQAKVLGHMESHQAINRSRTCVIVGDGSSLDDNDRSMLAGFDVIVGDLAGVDKELLSLARYITVADSVVAERETARLNDLVGVIKVYPSWFSTFFAADANALFLNATLSSEFSTAVEKEISWQNDLLFFNLQFVYGLGYERVLLLGFEHASFQEQVAGVETFAVLHERARVAYERVGRAVLNCTPGASLSGFPCATLESAFVLAASAHQQVLDARGEKLRVLVLSASEINSQCATGALKSLYFWGMDDCEIFQLYVSPAAGVSQVSARSLAPADDDKDVFGVALHFCPHVVYFRPSDKPPHFFASCMNLIRMLDVPVVTHVMDDWVSRHDLGGLQATFRAQMREVLNGSAGRLAISPGMAAAYNKRYGHSFFGLANYVTAMPELSVSTNEIFTIRYCGGLDASMTRETIRKVACVVEELCASGTRIRFDIHTMPWYLAFAESMASVNVGFHGLASAAEYPKLLGRSDLLLIGYNFDEQSIAYVRYSIANKLADYLNSGVPVLLVGPREIETIGFCENRSIGVTCTDDDTVAIKSAVLKLVQLPSSERVALVQTSHAAYAEFCSSERSPQMFRAHLTNAAFSLNTGKTTSRGLQSKLKFSYRLLRLWLRRRMRGLALFGRS